MKEEKNTVLPIRIDMIQQESLGFKKSLTFTPNDIVNPAKVNINGNIWLTWVIVRLWS